MAHILCVGKDEALMTTRRLILEKAGHAVTQASDLREVIAACETNSFSVAVLGQSLPASEKLRITSTILRYCRDAKILELHNAIVPDVKSADFHVRISTSSPEALGDAVAALLRENNGGRKLQPSA